MTSSFPLDLRTARRSSGLTQSDCAFLLGAHRSKMSHLERGATVPSVYDICALALIYDTSFESVFNDLMDEITEDVRARVAAMPPAPKGWLGTANRTATLKALEIRLRKLKPLDNETA